MDMWQVIDLYFRAWIAWIDFQIFFPRSWFPNWQNVPGGFWFPGGATIGLALAINLVARTWRYSRSRGAAPDWGPAW